MNVVRKRLYIDGMTCINCQNKIEYKLKNTAGIQDIKVNYVDGYAELAYDPDIITQKDIQRILENMDYHVKSTKMEKDSEKKSAGSHEMREYAKRMTLLLSAILLLYELFQKCGILNLLVPSRLADEKMGYGMLFVIGILTSVHCVAMCGGINLSQSISSGEDYSGCDQHNQSKKIDLRPALQYNLGRVISYSAIGFLLGFVGMVIGGKSGMGISAIFQGVLKIIAGIFMVIMGINMLGIFPWLRHLNLRMPKRFARKIYEKKTTSRQAFVVGLLNGLMPCGPLQSMQIVALASGNPFAGAFAMFLFSLGTVPLMLGLGFLASVLKKTFCEKAMSVGAVLVVVLGLAMISQGGSLSGFFFPDQLFCVVIVLGILGVILETVFGKTMDKPGCLIVVAVLVLIGISGNVENFGELKNTDLPGNAKNNQSFFVSETEKEMTGRENDRENGDEIGEGGGDSEIQVIRSTLSSRKYPNITVQVGVPVKWIIEVPKGAVNGCNYKMLMREYGVEHTFSEGENVIEFTPTKTGTFSYTCWMGMIRGNIFVTDQKEGAEKASGEISVENSGKTSEASGESSEVPVSSGYSIPTDKLAISNYAEDENGQKIQEVRMDLTETGFSPAVIVVESDLPVKWVINNTLQDSAVSELLVPNYSQKLELFSGENPLYLYPQESFEVSTGDDRFFAYVKVVDDINYVDEKAIRQEVEEFDPLIYPEMIFESSGMSCCSGD